MRSDAESAVIVIWLVLGLLLLAGVVYDGAGNGHWGGHLLVLVAGELAIAAVARLVLLALRRRSR